MGCVGTYHHWLVHLDERGDRSFTFFRNPGADIMLTKEELSVHLLEQTQNFHFGSASLTDEPSRSAMSS